MIRGVKKVFKIQKSIAIITFIDLIIIIALLIFLPKQYKYISITFSGSLVVGSIAVIVAIYNNVIALRKEYAQKIEETRPKFSLTGESIKGSWCKLIIQYDCPNRLNLDMFSITFHNSESWKSEEYSNSQLQKSTQTNGIFQANESKEIVHIPEKVLSDDQSEYKHINLIEALQDKDNDMYLEIQCRTYYNEEIHYKFGHKFSDHYVHISSNKDIEKILKNNLQYSFYKEYKKDIY